MKAPEKTYRKSYKKKKTFDTERNIFDRLIFGWSVLLYLLVQFGQISFHNNHIEKKNKSESHIQ